MTTKIYAYLLMLIITILVSNPVFSQRPNFVIVMLDDMHEQSLPPIGPSFLDYPYIERIYQEGIRFCDVYCLQPLCNPSRYSMLTGVYPHVHGAIGNVFWPRADLPTFYSITADYGYHNAYIGKYSNVEYKSIPGLEKTLTLTKIFQSDPTMYYNGVSKTFNGNTTVIIDDSSEAWLANIDTPFIFGIGHIGTHTPISAVFGYQNDYNDLGNLPDNYFKYTDDFPSFLYADSQSFSVDSDQVKQAREKLFEIMSEIDRGVGNILSVLEDRGILDNTMIIFTNDNGFLYGEHQLAGKGDAREQSSSIPLFIRYPPWFAPGTTVCGNLLGLHDLCPTILDAAGISGAGYNFQGRPINYLLEPGHERTSIYLESVHSDSIAQIEEKMPSWRAVRTTTFKYIRYHCDASVEELFDLVADPNENSNLVNNSAYFDTLSMLRLLLDSLAIATNDTISADTVYLPCTLIECVQLSIFYIDADSDDYGNINSQTYACTAPPGYVDNSTDCDDENNSVYPGAIEINSNNIDDNCDGYIDEIGVNVLTVQNKTLTEPEISPNPTSGNFVTALRLEGFDCNTIAALQVTDIFGRVVYIHNTEVIAGEIRDEIQLMNLANGLYLLTVIVNSEVFSKRFVYQQSGR